MIKNFEVGDIVDATFPINGQELINGTITNIRKADNGVILYTVYWRNDLTCEYWWIEIKPSVIISAIDQLVTL